MNIGSFWFLIFILCFSTTAAFAACTSPAGNEGDVMYNKDNHVYQVCDGTSWKTMSHPWTGADGGGCTSPTGSPGDLMYNKDYCVLQFCDSSKWVPLAHPHAHGAGC